MSKANTKIEVLKNLFQVKNIITYIIAFMVSTVGMGQEVSPFSIAIVGACLASGVPAIGVVIVGLIGNIIGVGMVGALNYILIILMLLILMCIKPPRENDEYKNEEIQISKHIFASILLVMIAKLILTKCLKIWMSLKLLVKQVVLHHMIFQKLLKALNI